MSGVSSLGDDPDPDGRPTSALAVALLGGWSILSSVGVGLFGLGVGVVLALVAILGLGAAGVGATPLVVLVVSLVLVQGVAFGGVALAYLTLRDPLRDLLREPVQRLFGVSLRDSSHGLDWIGVRLPDLRDVAAVGLGYGAALGLGVGGAVLVSSLGVEAGSNQAAELATRDPSVLLLLIPASLLLIGPGEELLFRGIVQGRLRETFSAPVAVVVASVIFAAVHYVALSGSSGQRLVTIAILVGPALVFGTAYELTDNLVVPSLIHGAYNATLFTLLYVALRFAPQAGGV
jgi:membrane protease YdiL (CAAX protease family)